MPLTPPNLDDRSFDDLVAEARRLIPRYAPEWTDHNETDPGITLVQLFAWLSEMLIYKLNQVPERNYVKFLQLLGLELEPARPARAELTFTLARDDVETVLVPLGTEVAATGGGDPAPIFETDRALVALGAELAAVQSFDGFGYSLETTANQAADQTFPPFGPRAREGSALLLGFDSELDFTDQEINLTFAVAGDPHDEPSLCCDPDQLAAAAPATLVWEYWDGSYWQTLSLREDGTRAFSRSGHVYLEGPGTNAAKAQLGAVKDQELYWLRCRLRSSRYERAPRLEWVATNTVEATQAQTVSDEVLGGSDGRPGQSFLLAHTPVLVRRRPLTVSSDDVSGAAAAGGSVTVDSLRLEVDEGIGEERWVVWQEVPDFYASGPDDRHFVLNRTTGEVRFGDGRRGRIPVANRDNPSANVVARDYRYGGGKAANVGAGTLTELRSWVSGVDSVTNRRAATGGAGEETVAEAKARAPREIQSRKRAVTAADFELLALATPGVRVRRAKALPLHHPAFPAARIPGVVTVVVVPDSDDDRPQPGPETLAAVCAHLDQHRLLTTELHVVAPTYHRVAIEADVVVRPEADLAEVQSQLEDELERFFHPLEGGAEGQGWVFGRDVFYSEVYRVLLGVDGVDRIRDNQLLIWLDGERQEFCRDVPLEAGALLYSGEHDVRVAYDAADSSNGG